MTTLENFKRDLVDTTISDLWIVRRYITHGVPFVFADDEDKYFKLKAMIADKFLVNPQQVIMVGSAKLGFSINPSQLWKPFDDESDIDMVIVSDTIFNRFWKELYDFNIKLVARSYKEDEKYQEFLEYFFKGWFRPDYFPFEYPWREQWEEFFRSISYGEFGGCKITGALYHNFNFYERYHVLNIQRIRTGGIR